ncbi:MAG TPA: ssl1498 family light-harvesting-like protein [Oscillatoriales cyanobacterium M59_W2019_021]|nr:MAG: ssl1498 family light-harvesting-like protein [Cyanobacteria bacterium J055]HIK33166.1 ssl1498 family light-harvesting-like protein [Oscillatoriales cyanobacterium M4454_W2019_049]HIK50483.1 ssl1498 family light-harvesting-like protein [Oscillatoriales cyanobacterium M59_W2019_021]
MYTTVNEDGILNNYATEPQMYYAEYPSPEQQRRYAQLGGLAALLVSAVILTAVSVSSIV